MSETPMYDQLVLGLDIDPEEIREDQLKRHLAWVGQMADLFPDADHGPKWRANPCATTTPSSPPTKSTKNAD